MCIQSDLDRKSNAVCGEKEFDCGWEVGISCLIGLRWTFVVSEVAMHCEKSVFEPRAQEWTCSRCMDTSHFEQD